MRERGEDGRREDGEMGKTKVKEDNDEKREVLISLLDCKEFEG